METHLYKYLVFIIFIRFLLSKFLIIIYNSIYSIVFI
nr:MAG TPA: hypothetical protein [Caudoviricetes sp.]